MTKNDISANPTLNLSTEEMRTLGYQVVDLLVAHFDSLSQQKPVTHATRYEMDWLLTEDIPEAGAPPQEVLAYVQKNILANSALLTHPRWYSFVPSPNNFVSTIADTLATGFNIFSGAWVSSPGAAELELVTINWLLKLFSLPVREGGGLFVSGGSMANLIGLATARKIKLNNRIDGARLYFSDQAHSSVDRAALILGFQNEQIRKVSSDEQFRLSIDALKSAIIKDRAQGRVPFCVVANAGTTNTGSVDPLREIAILCRQEGLWMHVDAAYGGASIVCREGQTLLSGIEMADSVTVDPHKWFYQPYEIGCILVRDHRWLAGTFRVEPEYLRDITGAAEEVNFFDHGVQLTRCFRALKFYMSIKTFGLASFREAVRSNIELAETTERYLRDAPDWEIVSPATLAVINFRYRPHDGDLTETQLDDLNQHISSRVIDACEAMLATTILKRKTVLRMCLINPRTTFDDVRDTLNTLERYGREYLHCASSR
jgi:glutamate/tyrosine decarboxylase-like PLP-dependent enzyme